MCIFQRKRNARKTDVTGWVITPHGAVLLLTNKGPPNLQWSAVSTWCHGDTMGQAGQQASKHRDLKNPAHCSTPLLLIVTEKYPQMVESQMRCTGKSWLSLWWLKVVQFGFLNPELDHPFPRPQKAIALGLPDSVGNRGSINVLFIWESSKR